MAVRFSITMPPVQLSAVAMVSRACGPRPAMRARATRRGGRGGVSCPGVQPEKATVATAIAAMPSRTTGKSKASRSSSPSRPTASTGRPRTSAISAAMAGDAGQPRRFADQRAIDIEDAPAARFHPRPCIREEQLRRRATPARIGGREMLADIAIADGAEQPSVIACIRGSASEWPRSARSCGILHRRGSHIAVGEGMDIIARPVRTIGAFAPRCISARARSASSVILKRFASPSKVAMCWPVAAMRPASSVKLLTAGLGHRAMRCEDRPEAEGLRGLHRTQLRAIRVAHEPTGASISATVSTRGQNGKSPRPSTGRENRAQHNNL